MNKKLVLVCDRFSIESLMLLDGQPHVQILKVPPDELKDHPQLELAHALLIRSRVHVDSELLTKAKKLELIITATSGFDHIDLDASQKWGITVMNTPNSNKDSAAQLTMALMLALHTNLIEAHRNTKTGLWRQDTLLGQEIFNKTWGIVGLGRIGSKVAELAKSFGMTILAYDPYLNDADFNELSTKRVSYEELLKLSDCISFHVPKTKETFKMLNLSQLEYINREAMIVNASRGHVIDEESIIKALENRWIKGLALDVYEKEPLPRTSKLLTFSNVILTPHIGAYTEDAYLRASEEAILKLIQFFRDGSTSDTLPPKANWYHTNPFTFI